MKTIKLEKMAAIASVMVAANIFASPQKQLSFSAEQIKETPYFYCDILNDTGEMRPFTFITFKTDSLISFGKMRGKEINNVDVQGIKTYYFSLWADQEILGSVAVTYFTNDASEVTCNIGKGDRTTSYNIVP